MAVQSVNSINNTMASPVRNVNNLTKDQFQGYHDGCLNNVNALEQESAGITEDFISGRTDNIHSVLIAAEKASISQFIMEVRNKVIEAYQEIMRMQI